MKTYQCINCGFQIQRAVTPLSCPACGQQRVGLYKEVDTGAVPQQPLAPAATQHPAAPAVLTPPPPPGATAPVYPASPSPPQPPAAPAIPLQPQQQPAASQQPAPQASQPAPAQPVGPPVGAQPQAPPPEPPLPSPPPPAPQPAAPKKPAATAPPSPTRRPSRAAPAKRPPSAVQTKPKKAAAQEVPIPKVPRRRPAKPQAAEESPPQRRTAARPERFVFMFPEEGPAGGPSAGVRGRAAVDNDSDNDGGHVYACVGGRLVALRPDGDTFSVDWIYSTDSHIPGPAAIGPDGNIRLHAGDGTLHCVTRAGKQAWAPVAVGDPLGWASPVIDERGNSWVCSYLGGLLKIDEAGSTSDRPYFRTRQKFDSTGTIHNGVFYAGGEDGFVYAIDLASGRRGRNVWDHDQGAGKTDWFINCELIVAADGTLVVASRDDSLYGFNADGQQVWRTEMPGQILTSPVLGAGGEIYLGLNCTAKGMAEQGRLVCVSGNSHKITWQHATDAAIESTPVVDSDGVIYVGDNAGVVHAVGSDGTEQWTAQLAAPVRSAGAMIAPGRVAFGLDDDTLVVLKCD